MFSALFASSVVTTGFRIVRGSIFKGKTIFASVTLTEALELWKIKYKFSNRKNESV